MNLFQIILKNMRQRALGTWLTLLSVTLGVALAIAVLIVYREGKSLFGQTEFGYDVIIGVNRGSPMQLVMNTVYHIDQSPGNIPYSMYEMLVTDNQYRRNVKIAVPIAVGDSYLNHRIVATLPKMFGFENDGKTPLPADSIIRYSGDKAYEFETGGSFHADKFEAVIGADVPQMSGLDMGGTFQMTHGVPEPNAEPDVHDETWKVVGRLKKTGTAIDRVIFIPLITFYCVPDHEEGLSAQAMIRAGIDPTKLPEELQPKPDTHAHDHGPATQGDAADDHDDHAVTDDHDDHAVTDDHDDHAEAGHGHGHNHDHHDHVYHINDDGTVELHMPKDQWALSAVLVKARGGDSSAFRANELMYMFRVRNEALAVNPAQVMREFFDTFLRSSTLVLLLVSALVTIVAAVGILVSIYNSVAARRREIAILRALGATRAKVLSIICLEAGLIGLVGGLLGLVLGHAVAAVGSGYMKAFLGQSIRWTTIDERELLYLVGVVVLATLAGLVPAAAAYKTPVATNLVPS
ncbi:MAG TPA: FtsX-like permease family protein [Tepidisphaeraceae bacterium]|jgi:putative ABC transport system permease protein|nr:FtsX-like permease family protein [Tepidisphaeraceae bacterium]